MKRLLSLLLAVTMIVGLLPIASAEETTLAETMTSLDEKAGITLVYDISSAINKFKSNGATLKGADSFFGKGYYAFDYDATGGFFEYAANKSRDKYSWEGGYNYPATVGGRQVAEARSSATAGASGIQMLGYYRASEGLLNNWFAIKINVPKSGTYTPKATYWKYNKDCETYLDYYLIKDTGEELGVALDEARLEVNSEYYIGSKNCVDTTAAGAQTIVLNEAFENDVTLEEGEYYLVYKPRVVTVAADYIGNYAVASNFTLDGGLTSEPVPMTIKTYSDSVRVFDGGGTANLSTKVFMSDGTEKKATNAVYTALTPEFATIDEATGIITGVAPGEAKFEVTATENGKEYKAEISLPVVSNKLAGITVKYDLSGAISKLSAAGATLNGEESFFGKGYSAFSYDETNGFFEYAANKTKGKYSWDDDGYNYPVTISSRQITRMRTMDGANGLQFLSFYKASEGEFSSWWALKIKVPASGIYTPRASYWKYNKDGETYLDYFLIKNTGEDIKTLLDDSKFTTDSENYIGSKACEDTSISGAQKVIVDEAFENSVNLESGEYYLVYKPRIVKNSSNYIGNYSIASSFTLDGGNTKAPVPMSVRIKADSDNIVTGGGIAKVTADVYLSDGTVRTTDDVKLTAITPDFATVDETFGVIIGNKAGVAKFTCEVSFGGKTLDGEFSIDVVENTSRPGEGELVTYDISSRLDKASSVNGADSFGGLGYSALSYDSNDGLWEYAANKTNGKYSWDEGGWTHTTYNVDKSLGGGGYTRFRQSADSKRNGLQMLAKYDTWFAIKIKVPKAGLYLPASTYWMYGGRGNGAESYMDYFLIKNDGTEMSALLDSANLTTSSNGYIGSKSSVDSSLASGQSFVFDEPFDDKISLEDGEYYLVYKPRSIKGSDNYVCASNFTLDGVNCVKDVYVNAKTDIEWDEESKISVLPIRLDGTAVAEGDYTVTYSSSKTTVATVSDDGVVKGINEGSATIDVTVSDGIGSITKSFVFNVTDNSGMKDVIFNVADKIYLNQKILLDADAVMNSENVLDIPDDCISYSVSPSDIITISGGVLLAVKEGTATVTTYIEFKDEKKSLVNEITVVPGTGKTEPTIYTNKERGNALNNIAKYDWAKKTQKNAIKNADSVLERIDILRSQIFGEGLPRGRQLGCKGDEYYIYCRYCHARIDGDYSWSCSFAVNPWKVQCTACKNYFPSNDFESFLNLGLDETGLFFDVDRARQAHHEMLFHGDGSECTCEKPKTANTPEWYIFYGYGNPEGYLYNELYKEIRESNTDPWGDKITWNGEAGADLGTYKDENSGEILWTGGSMWGVDDGWGYLPGRKYDDGLTERHGYIALYNYKFWMHIYNGVLTTVGDAYLYTGDEKYGLAGAKFLDRVADVWGSFNMYYFRDKFLNTHGGSGYGAATGRINDNELGRAFCYAVDTFYPMITNEKLMRELSADAESRGLANKKTSSEDIWRNWADGILITSADMCMDGRINGNYGQAQAVAALAAIALHEQPKTDEIIEWLYRSGGTQSNGTVSGGNFEAKLMNDVDRDGFGNEASPRYNTSWVGTLRIFADQLRNYDGDKNYNPYENAKFAKMYDPQTNILLANSKHPNIGDAGSPASITVNGAASVWYNAFTKIENEEYKRKIAQYLYYITDGNLKQFGNSIFAANPESAEDELMKYVDEDAEMGSIMLGGYGFAALRDGNNYKSASADTDSNTHRDFWMWFGNRGASHSHADALNIGIDAFGLDIAPDLGYPEDTSYTPNRLQWVNTTLSHNTVVVDEKGQGAVKGIHGYPYHFDDSGKVKLMDADMKSVYPQTENYRRTIVMIEANDEVAYGIDFFRVTGGNHHLYSFHSQAENAYPISGIELTPDPVVQDKDGKNIVGSYAGPEAPFGNDPWTKDAWSYETFYPRGYTWLRNVRRDKEPESQFTVEFNVKDYRKVLKDSSGIKLRLTQLNNFTPTEVAIAGGYMTVKSDTKMMPKTLDYVLVEREGENLDSLFTTVYQPYRNTPYIESVEELDIKIKDGNENSGDIARAVKVKHTEASGGRCDYVVYATNKDVVYTITDSDFSFDFSGFVGVYTLNSNGAMIYRYVNDGTIIGEETGKPSAYEGTVVSFQKENAFDNYIDVNINCDDLSDIAGKYIYVNNDGVHNAAYQIVSASENQDGTIRLNLGTVTLIRSLIDKNDIDKGYVYNIKEGQTFSIPTSFVDASVPEFENVSNALSTAAGSTINVTLRAKSPIKEGTPAITYIGTSLPRGATLDEETGVLSWKPTASQIGENHIAITARDSDGRESTIHFDITVYGSTSGGTGGGGVSGNTGAPAPSTPSDDKGDVGTGLPDGPSKDDSTASGGVENVRFIDLHNHAWAESAINSLADEGIIKGTSGNTFSPAANITRADFAILLVRAFKLSSENEENFADVSASDYFAKELAVARNTGLINGVGENNFAPRNNITRQDMMVIVYRALNSLPLEGKVAPKATDEVSASDFNQVSDYAREAVTALVNAKLVNGKNGLIEPLANTTRAEVAVLIQRILDFIG